MIPTHRCKTLVLLLVLLTNTSLLFAQTGKRPHRERGNYTVFSDSASATSAEYMLHLEEAIQKLDSIQNESSLRPDVFVNRDALKASDSIVHFVDQSLQKYSLNLRSLELLKVLLSDAQRDLRRHYAFFQKSYKDLDALRNELRALRRDTTLRQLFRDTVARKAFRPQLLALRSGRRQTDSLLTVSLSTVNTIKAQASANSILSTQLMGRLNTKLNSAGKEVLQKELPYLWQLPSQDQPDSPGLDNFKGEQKALYLYFRHSAGIRYLRWIFGIAFLWWVLRNVRVLRRHRWIDNVARDGVIYLVAQPIASAFAVIFSIAPLFDLDAPAGYMQLVLVFLMISLTFIFYKQWRRRLFYFWLAFIALFFCFALFDRIAMPAFWQRCLILLLNTAGAVVAFRFRKLLPEGMQLLRFIRVVLALQVGMHVLAILFQVYGRVTISQMLGTASIYSITQVLGLSVLVRVLVEAVLLQIHTSRIKNKLESAFDSAPIVQNFRRPLLAVALLMWFIVFATNLNMYNAIYEGMADLLSTPRTIGQTSFTFGSILLFMIIIWLAHFFQRYVGYFFGDVGDDESEGLAQRSKLLVTRLVLLAVGYLLAVAASGLPIDKVTIVLGALGVGIGLGLQNIVNNFVSGIILIFDRPLKVGDSIELGGHAGRVKEIGIRSSTLTTVDGADVIIPNGDVLSQHIVNWTHANPYKRIDFSLDVETTEDKDKLVALIKDTIQSSDLVLQKREPVVLLENIKGNSVSLKIYFWCEDFYKSDAAKSEVWYKLYQELKGRGMKVS
jgi:small-conductance mechanosensitive channel